MMLWHPRSEEQEWEPLVLRLSSWATLALKPGRSCRRCVALCECLSGWGRWERRAWPVCAEGGSWACWPPSAPSASAGVIVVAPPHTPSPLPPCYNLMERWVYACSADEETEELPQVHGSKALSEALPLGEPDPGQCFLPPHQWDPFAWLLIIYTLL